MNEIQIKGAEQGVPIKPFEHHARYSEADPQGFIHHAHYIDWMEDARQDLFEQLGLGYKHLKAMEVISPTLSESVEHRREVKVDETVVIETKLLSYDGRKMEIGYRIYDKVSGEDRAVGRTSHCFLNKSGIPISLKRIYPELETRFFEYQ